VAKRQDPIDKVTFHSIIFTSRGPFQPHQASGNRERLYSIPRWPWQQPTDDSTLTAHFPGGQIRPPKAPHEPNQNYRNRSHFPPRTNDPCSNTFFITEAIVIVSPDRKGGEIALPLYQPVTCVCSWGKRWRKRKAGGLGRGCWIR
jgi:hypothetical protein